FQIIIHFCKYFSYFFFQAEDGIRDRNVTGVQTCALPICARRRDRGDRAGAGHALSAPTGRLQRAWRRGERVVRGMYPRAMRRARSEERRVGKECRWLWWAEHEKEKE